MPGAVFSPVLRSDPGWRRPLVHTTCGSQPPRRAPTASVSSSRCTYFCAAPSIAARTSGSIVDPLMIVYVPRALINGRTPIDW